MPAGQGAQEVEPCAAHEPAAQGVQAGAAAHAQLLSAADLTRVDCGPAMPAAHENKYDVAPMIGAVNCTRFAPGKEAAEGCESATTSGVERVRL